LLFSDLAAFEAWADKEVLKLLQSKCPHFNGWLRKIEQLASP
jgi:hypothetical protein